MNPGDLVKFNNENDFYNQIFKYGLVTMKNPEGGDRYCWVLFFGTNPPVKKWCEVKNLEVISETG